MERKTKGLSVGMQILIGIISIVALVMVAGIIGVTLHRDKPDTQIIEVEKEQCKHEWTVLDKNDEYYSSLVNCKKCGELVIIDYRNHRMKIKE